MSGEGSQRGFTLIEILVVVIIVGLLATVAVFSMGDSSRHRELENQAREFFLILQIARERSVLDNSEIGVHIEDNQIRFLGYDPQERVWEALTESPFSQQQWSEPLTVEVATETDPPQMPTQKEKNERPDLVFFSSGETTPFRLRMGIQDDPDYIYRIETDGLNPMQLLEPGEESEVRLE